MAMALGLSINNVKREFCALQLYLIPTYIIIELLAFIFSLNHFY